MPHIFFRINIFTVIRGLVDDINKPLRAQGPDPIDNIERVKTFAEALSNPQLNTGNDCD